MAEIKPNKMRRSASLNRNHYFVFGILFGLALSFYFPQSIWKWVQQEECPQQEYENYLKYNSDFEPHLNLINKPLAAKKQVKNMIRPRYYSSELGIREKIFIAVMTSKDNINTLATAINRTTAHLVNRIKFFINAENFKSDYKLKNIVGFTGSRDNLRPFHIIKYIADNCLDAYDYFLIIPDTVYVDGRKLTNMVNQLSITFDLYMGTNMKAKRTQNLYAINDNLNDYDNNENLSSQEEQSYCDLNAGILFSSNVMGKMRNNLEWCIRNSNSDDYSVNIGRCVKFSTKLSNCQKKFQDIAYRVHKISADGNVAENLSNLSQTEDFKKAIITYPLKLEDDFYRLHGFFSRQHLEQMKRDSYALENKSYNIANGSVSQSVLQIQWPLGVEVPSTPETRHDINHWNIMNETHIFLPNAAKSVTRLDVLSGEDFQRVLEIAQNYATKKHDKWTYVGLHSAYRRFDATRGMDYNLHLNFLDSNGQSQIASLQLVKPLGRTELIPSLYVTESTRIAILVPIFEHQVTNAANFVNQYEQICMKNQDNTFLLMIFLYGYDSESKGDSDPFAFIKRIALDLSSKYKADGSRIAWVSIRLPAIYSLPVTEEEVSLSSLYGMKEFLSIAITDLALPKIELDSLVLMASTSMSFKQDFLNRVRMNTIKGYQIYSPIGFMMYPCKLAFFCKDCDVCDVSQSSGYFDKVNYDVVSFYNRDYVLARKRTELLLPIMRSDNDIEYLNSRIDKNITTIVDIFIHSQLPVHILRGVEPNLRYGEAIRKHFTEKKEIPKCPHQNKVKSQDICIHLASRKQIGDAIIHYKDKTIVYK